MKNLKDILYQVSLNEVVGSTAGQINHVHFDSRQVGKGDLFVAIRGAQADGHAFIEAAIERGATAVLVEQMPSQLHEGVVFLQVADTSIALAIIAANYYDRPSKQLKLIGVTGTNGKTTTTSLLYQLFTNLGYACGLISTVHVLIDQEIHPTKHTTPDALKINRYLRMMVDEGVDFCFMEVSSHGIDQGRTHGLTFAGGMFTNLSHDHLDYHPTFAAYRDVKKLFFDQLGKKAFAITNKDDKNGMYMLQNSAAKKRTYALKSMADYHTHVIENHFGGLLLKINQQEVWCQMIGAFNAYNLTAVYGCAVELGEQPIDVLAQLSKLNGVAGRFQYFTSPVSGVTVIVDYAHTPDALANVLSTINDIRTKNETLYTIVGCGGDRDRTKRPKMAAIAATHSDQVILTSDNPRTEDPQGIIEEMEEGVPPQYFSKSLSIVNRKQAIKAAVSKADGGDIILIAGKGHETYQEINGVRHDFDDYAIVKDLLKQMDK